MAMVIPGEQFGAGSSLRRDAAAAGASRDLSPGEPVEGSLSSASSPESEGAPEPHAARRGEKGPGLVGRTRPGSSNGTGAGGEKRAPEFGVPNRGPLRLTLLPVYRACPCAGSGLRATQLAWHPRGTATGSAPAVDRTAESLSPRAAPPRRNRSSVLSSRAAPPATPRSPMAPRPPSGAVRPRRAPRGRARTRFWDSRSARGPTPR